MTDTKKNINKLVSTKMKSRAERLAEAAKKSDNEDDNEEIANIITDYRIYCEGAIEALRAAGVEEADSKAFELLNEALETEMKLLEQKFHLQEMLSEEEEKEE